MRARAPTVQVDREARRRRREEGRACIEHVYLHVGREEGELQRPAVLHAAGDRAGEDEPAEADRRGRVRRRRRAAAAPGAADAHRELELAVAASHGVHGLGRRRRRGHQKNLVIWVVAGRSRNSNRDRRDQRGRSRAWEGLCGGGVTRMERVGEGRGGERARGVRRARWVCVWSRGEMARHLKEGRGGTFVARPRLCAPDRTGHRAGPEHRTSLA